MKKKSVSHRKIKNLGSNSGFFFLRSYEGLFDIKFNQKKSKKSVMMEISVDGPSISTKKWEALTLPE